MNLICLIAVFVAGGVVTYTNTDKIEVQVAKISKWLNDVLPF